MLFICVLLEDSYDFWDAKNAEGAELVKEVWRSVRSTSLPRLGMPIASFRKAQMTYLIALNEPWSQETSLREPGKVEYTYIYIYIYGLNEIRLNSSSFQLVFIRFIF